MTFKTTRALVFALTLAGLGPVHAEDPTKEPTSMKEVVEALRNAPTAAAETMHFEITAQNTTIGYLIASLRPASGDPPALDYRVETVMKLPNGVRFEGVVTAQMNLGFEPSSIDFRREGKAPDGQKQLTVERVRVREKDIVLVREEGGVTSLPKSIPRPENPFAFGLEFLVQRVDAAKHPSFVVQELNPQTGEMILHTFRVEPQPDGTRTVNSRKADGSEGYAFTLDASNKLQSWREPPVLVVSKRCAESRIAEIKTQLGL